MMLNKMIDFYQTQDLRKQINSRSDLVAISNIVLEYDPSQHALLVTRFAMENEQDHVVPLAPPSLQPKVTTLPLPSPEARSDWQERIIELPEQAEGFDYFEEEEVVRDDGGRRRGARSRRARRPVRVIR
jgi:hypothetical protein